MINFLNIIVNKSSVLFASVHSFIGVYPTIVGLVFSFLGGASVIYFIITQNSLF